MRLTNAPITINSIHTFLCLAMRWCPLKLARNVDFLARPRKRVTRLVGLNSLWIIPFIFTIINYEIILVFSFSVRFDPFRENIVLGTKHTKLLIHSNIMTNDDVDGEKIYIKEIPSSSIMWRWIKLYSNAALP